MLTRRDRQYHGDSTACGMNEGRRTALAHKLTAVKIGVLFLGRSTLLPLLLIPHTMLHLFPFPLHLHLPLHLGVPAHLPPLIICHVPKPEKVKSDTYLQKWNCVNVTHRAQ